MILIQKAKSKKDKQFDAAQAKAAVMSSAVKISLNEGLVTFKSRVDVEELASFLAKQDPEAALNSINWNALPTHLNKLGPAVLAGIIDGGQNAHDFFPALLRSEIRFDSSNPRIDKILQTRVGSLITDISSESRETVRGIIRQAVDTGVPVSSSARMIRDVVGLTDKQSIAVMNFRNALEADSLGLLTQNQRRAVAPRMFAEEGYKINLSDPAVRARFQRLARQKDIDKMVEDYSFRLLKQRSENIARTESFTAINEGQREFWNQAEEQGIVGDNVRKEWLIDFGTACELCRPLHGQRVRLNELYMTAIGPVVGPTLHPQCNCMEALVFLNPNEEEQEAA